MSRPPARENMRNFNAAYDRRGTAVAADQEVGRDQRRLEEHVEEEDVGRSEDADDQTLEREHQREERAHAPAGTVGVVPAGNDDDRHEDRRHEDEREPDPVDADGVVDAQRLDPGVLLAQLEAGAVEVVLRQDRQRDRERHERDAERRPLREVGPAARQEGDDSAAEERDDQEDRQPGEGHVTHARFTARRARTRTRAPPKISAAYVRTNPVCSLRRPRAPSPTSSAVPLTAPSIPLPST